MAQSNAENHELTMLSPDASSSSGDTVSLKEKALETLRDLSKKPQYKDLLESIFYDAKGVKRGIPLLDANDAQVKTPLQEVITNIDKPFSYLEAKNIIELLLQAGASIEATSRSCRRSPLCLAILYADTTQARELMTLLLQHDANINAYDASYGCHLLGMAILKHDIPRRLEKIEFLLSNQADQEKCFYPTRTMFAPEKHYVSALAQAALLGFDEVVSILLRHNANVNVKTADGTTPLYIAVSNRRAKIVKLLLDANADFNATPNQSGINMPPLTLASSKGYDDIVTLLLAKGANVNETDEKGMLSPLWVACSNQKWSTAALLLGHGADPNTIYPSMGQTPLHLSALYGNLEISQLLLKHGANPTLLATRGLSSDNEKKTPREFVDRANKTLIALLESAESSYSAALAMHDDGASSSTIPLLLTEESPGIANMSPSTSADDHEFAPSAKRHCRR